MMPEILYEDNHIIAVNKRPSDLSQGDRSGDPSLDDEVKKYIARKYNKPGEVFLGVVHRLDRPVSGVILYARTSKALSRLNEMFRTSEVMKVYLAIVKNRPPEDTGTISHYLKKNEKQKKTYVYDTEVKGSKKASLTYRVAGRSDRYYLLEVILHSGRHHQIRAQLAEIGCPVKGDLKYGFSRSNDDGSISLMARRLEFIHPVKKEKIIITAPFPEGDIWQVFKNVNI
ncbi:MAG TPA: RluA family pseudouridine synthase [Bacteroidales bacterium]|jgi:23S rRNA pseudouridine1911/1915/1917 synthase|nr:MAG: tRNA pseudouridine synthase C [Bacteroidetes bacterium ADurb.Bin145]HOU03311.1 RluA family pseudouridine synthase [Bacteroidales bacterium]HQK69233.1 RluA family pseudouridine synthase [Bacteroidales bacterium]